MEHVSEEGAGKISTEERGLLSRAEWKTQKLEKWKRASRLFTTSRPRCQDSFQNQDPTVCLLRNAFYNFTMGNRPKMSLKYAIFKICPKLARKWYSCETKGYSTIFGDSWRQKVVSVFGFGHPKSHLFAPKNGHFQWFWVQKNGTFLAYFPL